MIVKIVVAVAGGFLGWVYMQIKPPAPRVCGSPNGPPITSPRVQLNDGRHISYKEWGISKGKAKYKIIIIHGFDSSKDLQLPLSQEKTRQQGVYESLYRDIMAGYGKCKFDQTTMVLLIFGWAMKIKSYHIK